MTSSGGTGGDAVPLRQRPSLFLCSVAAFLHDTLNMRHNRTLSSTRPTAWVPAAALTLAFLLMTPCHIWAQTSLSPNVLVVYNSADSGSTAVASYYIGKRGIPSQNLCPITPPNNAFLNWSDFVSSVKTPIQSCLSQSTNRILYIVFTYNTPYKVIAPDNASYALDQFVADIWDIYTPPGQYGIPGMPQPYYAESQSQGNVYVPFLPFVNFSGPVIYSVWRLDAATPALAEGLIDKALLAESTGLSGQVCIDESFATASADYSSGDPDWDLRQSATFAREAGLAVTQDFNSAEFGTSPAPLRCDNAALYAGWNSLNHYNDAFSWNPGAIGLHLDSESAVNPRGGTNWSANALIRGITVTSGSVAEPYTHGLPRPDGIFRNLFEGANVGDAVVRNTEWLKWVIINMGDPLYRPFPAGFSSVTAPQNSLALNPRYLIGGNQATGTITLAAPAPSGGTTVALSSNQTAAATVPPSVVIAGGQTTASFPISTKLVTRDSPLYISAIFGTTTLTNTLVPQALLGSLTVSPPTMIGGTSATGFVFLNAGAPAGGIVVTLSSNNGAASVPSTVSVSEGTTSASFPITTTAVALTTSVTISGTYNGAVVIKGMTLIPLTPASVTLSPSSIIGSTASTANKVTMNGIAPADTVVNLSSNNSGVTVPASVTVAAGTSVSPVFTITTSLVSATTQVTISASYNGVSKMATLTVNPIVATPVLSPTSVVGGVSTTANKVTLNIAAPAGGLVVNLSSSDPGVGVPASVSVAAGATASPVFTITTSSVSATLMVTISATYNGVTRTAALTDNPVALLSVTLYPTTVVGGVSTTLNKVNLNGPAPAGGVSVNLTSSDPGVGVPTSVTVAAGATASPTFTITTSSVSATVMVTISASYNGVTKTAVLTDNPVALLSVALSPTSVVGGVSTTLNKVNLNGPAPAGGISVNLTSSNPGVTVPPSVTVAAGATSSPYFTITTPTVVAQTVVTISASYNGVTKTANLTVNQ